VSGVAKVVRESTFGEAGTGRGFDGHNARVALAFELAPDVGHGQAGKVRSAAGAGDNHIGVVAGHGHLLDGFEADDGLMQQHVIEHASQSVLGVGVLGGHFDGFRDGDAERTAGVGMLRQNRAAGLGLDAGTGDDRGSKCFNQRTPVGLLVKADTHHIDLAVQPEKCAGHG
jgi:hypothetical protein